MRVRIIYDDVIFRLQRIGGISGVFYQIISKFNFDKEFEVGIISTTRNQIDNLYWKSLINIKSFIKRRIPKSILQFTPFLIFPSVQTTLYHFTYYNFPLFKFKNQFFVITIHDLGYEKKIMQSGFKRLVNVFFKKIAILRADGIICVSNNTYLDLFEYYGKYVRNKCVKVIYNGISDNYINQTIYDKITDPQKILFVGSRQGYKNFEKVVFALSKLVGYHLVILGGGKLSNSHFSLLESMLIGRYTFINDISEKELINQYNSAFCLIYPSSYEGFGLPVIEAMASGCPVITCSNSSMIEIAETYSILIPIAEPHNIINAIFSLENEVFRRDLILRAKEHSNLFNWESTYLKMKDFYGEVVSLRD
jgi:glycosyltransferase involved in cell wall biosynthesis